MPKHKSEDYKKTAVEYYLFENPNQIKTCKIFKCSERSLMRWVEKYKKTGNIKRKKRNYIAYKVKEKYVKFIKEVIKKNKTITMKDLLEELRKKYPSVNITQMHLSRIVRDNNITLKQLRLRHEPKTRFKKPVNIKEQLKKFYEEIKKHKLDDIICIDETSLNSFLIRKQCYEHIGRKCVVKTESQEVFKKYTGIFAISTKGIEGYKIYDKGGIDSDRLLSFLKENITDKYKKKVIILDNASSHRNAEVKKVIEKDNILMYSIPYQHYTNSIEQFFSILKSRLRKMKGNSLTQLKANIKTVLENRPINTYKNIFKGSYKREVKYKPKKQSRLRKPKKYKL